MLIRRSFLAVFPVLAFVLSARLPASTTMRLAARIHAPAPLAASTRGGAVGALSLTTASGLSAPSLRWGTVYAGSAIESLSQPGTLSGAVTDAGNGLPLFGVAVDLYAAGGGVVLDNQITGADGHYGFSLAPGSYRVTASLMGYDSMLVDPITVIDGGVATQDFALTLVPAVTSLTIARSGTNALLRWDAVSGNVTGYELWRGTSPYLVPGTGDAQIIADGGAPGCVLVGNTITCTDAAMVGDPVANHFYLVRVIGAGGGRSLSSNRVGEFDYALEAPSVTPLPLGSLTVTTGPYTCTGQQCYDVQIQCPQVAQAIGATLRVGEPTAQPERGTLVFFTGWVGTSFLEEWGTEVQRILADLRATGYRTVQVKWSNTWFQAANNEPAGFARLACRPATVAQWSITKWRQPDVQRPVCVYGHSNGATAVAFLLARYGLADVLSAAMMDGGPNFTRLDAACLQDDPQYSALWYSENQRSSVDWSFGYPTAKTGPCSKQDVTWRPQFQETSVALGPWQFVYPRTMVHFIFGELDQTQTRAHGEYFYQTLAGFHPPLLGREVVPGVGHEVVSLWDGADAAGIIGLPGGPNVIDVFSTPAGANVIRDGLIADCQWR